MDAGPRAAPFRHRGMTALATVAAIGVLAYAGALAALYAFQERLIFLATPLPAGYRFVFDAPFDEMHIPVQGASLDALYFPRPSPRGLVFFLHGNAGNLATWTTGIDFFRRADYGLFMVDYRGYGKSTGRIESEEQLHADVRAAYDAIAPRYAGKPIVVYGRSLGTGLAARLARGVNPALLVLVSPYASLEATAVRAYPIVPAALLKYPLRTDALIGDVTCPIFIVHGADDRVIPVGDSETLRTLANAPVELEVVPRAGHNDLHTFPAYVDALAARLARVSEAAR